MAKEEHRSRGPYAFFPSTKLRTRQEVLDELSKPAGRFTAPTTTEQRIDMLLARYVQRVDPLGYGQIFVGEGLPLQWQSILQFLYEQTVIARPSFESFEYPNDRPHVPNFCLALNTTARPTDGRISGHASFGADLDAEKAVSKTIGEGLERYFLGLYQKRNLLHTTPASLKKQGVPALNLETVSGFLPWQRELFPSLTSGPDTEFYWTEGHSYPNRARILLPAQLVYWNYRHSTPGFEEPMLAKITTSGCAGHFSREEAVLAGLLELIQRDAFLVFWLNGIAPPKLDISHIEDPKVHELLEQAQRYGLSVTFLNTTSDLRVPTITCVVEDALIQNGPAISVGSSSGFSIGTLLQQSLLEALLINAHTGREQAIPLPNEYRPFSDSSINRGKRLRIWKGQEMARRFSFFTAGEMQDARSLAMETMAGATALTQLSYVLDILCKHGNGYEVYTYEAADTVLNALGYHVVRVIVPQLVPMYLWEFAAPLDSKRLREAPVRMGYKAASTYTPWPHPFP